MSVHTEILMSVHTEILMSVLYFKSLPCQSFFHQVSPPVDHLCFPCLFCFFLLILLKKMKQKKMDINRTWESWGKQNIVCEWPLDLNRLFHSLWKYQYWQILLMTYLNVTNCFVQKKVVFSEDNSATYLWYGILPFTSNIYYYS